MNTIQKVVQKIPVYDAIQWGGTAEDALFFAATIPNFWYGTVPGMVDPTSGKLLPVSEGDVALAVGQHNVASAQFVPEPVAEDGTEDGTPVAQEPTNDPEEADDPIPDPVVPLLGLVRNPWEYQYYQLNVGDWVLIFPDAIVAQSEQDFINSYEVQTPEIEE